MSSEHLLYRHSHTLRTVWSNPKNLSGRRGGGGKDVRYPQLEPGRRLVMAELDGPGVIDMLWLTLNFPGKRPFPQSMLRNQRIIIECFWDDSPAPAVSAPIGDFFGHLLGYDIPFENSLFADPSGRSFQSFIPMPFRKRARVELFNAFSEPIDVYHDVRMRKGVDLRPEDGYFHAYWHRSAPVAAGDDHEILPLVRGEGRYLGTHLGIMSDPANNLEWHAGNLKFFTDGDLDSPTMMTATLDDYCGSSWDYDLPYMHQDSGLLFSRYFEAGGGHHALYCYHRRDPFYFHESCRVTMRPRCGLPAARLVSLLRENPAIREHLGLPRPLSEIEERAKASPDEWVECDRSDDISTIALYYLNAPDGRHRRADRCEDWLKPGWSWPA